MNKQKILLSIIFTIAAIAIVVFVIVPETTSQASQEEVKTIKVGSIVGLTGGYAQVGKNWSNGVALAEKQFEAKHPNMDVKVIQEDSEFDTKTGVTAYQKLENTNDIDALINFGTFTLDGIYDLVTQKSYPVIQGGSQSSTPQNDNVIRVQPGNIPAEKALGEYAKQQGYTDVAVFYTDQNAFNRFFSAIKEGYGSEVNGYALSPDKKTGFNTQVTKALSQNPDAVILVTLPQQGAAITSTILERTDENRPRILHDSNFQTGFADYKRLLGNQFSQIKNDVFLKMVSTTRDDFKQAYRQEYSKEPGALADVGYDAFMLLMQNYSANDKQWVENVKNANFEGASGKVTFDEVGVRKPNFEIVELGEDLEL